ncbi:MAG TPA: helix-turn-helix domain-containing protein [Pyrinomonadaceae bacterium]|nr:helix-turn-helix domain-containing protein [Pyrinomonadaceae bacterium]
MKPIFFTRETSRINMRDMAALTTKEMSERFGVSEATVRLWLRRGLFPQAYKVETPRGAIWMIPEGDLKGFRPPQRTSQPPKNRDEAEKSVAMKRARQKDPTRLLKTLS